MKLMYLQNFFIIILTTSLTTASQYNQDHSHNYLNFLKDYRIVHPHINSRNQVNFMKSSKQLGTCFLHELKENLHSEYALSQERGEEKAYLNLLVKKQYIAPKNNFLEDYLICCPQSDIHNMVSYPLSQGDTGYCHGDQLADWVKNEYDRTYEKQAYLQTLIEQGYLWHRSMLTRQPVQHSGTQNNSHELYDVEAFIENYFIFVPNTEAQQLVTYLKAPTNFPNATIPYNYLQKLKNTNVAQCMPCDLIKSLKAEYNKAGVKQVYLYQLLQAGCIIPSSGTPQKCAQKLLVNIHRAATLSPNYNRGEATIYEPILSKNINKKAKPMKNFFDNTSEQDVDNFNKENNEIQKNHFIDSRTQEQIDADKITAQKFQPNLEDLVSIIN